MDELNINHKDILIRLVSLAFVLIICICWPEKYNNQSIAIFFLITITLLYISETEFIILFIASFLAASFFAFVNYLLLTPDGLFETNWQEPLVSDSQFFLYQSRIFLTDFDPSALLSTWGSLIPVTYGAIALSIFQNHYIGIVYLNCLLFALSISHLSYMIDPVGKKFSVYMPVCLMPLQSFYNSMLAKEVLYLFLVIQLFYLHKLINESEEFKTLNILRLIIILTTLLLFRPTGALIFICVIGYRAFSLDFKMKLRSILIFSLAAIFTLLLIDSINYTLPLFILGGNDELSLDSHLTLNSIWMESKGIPQILVPFFMPPWSVPLAPVLSILWLISPLPLFGALIDSLIGFQIGRASFLDFATVVRYLDSIIIFYILFQCIRLRLDVFKNTQPIILFLLIQILAISSFQFFESGRHRYLPGVMFMILYIYYSSFEKSNQNFKTSP
jgi:hypothetical protein